MASESSDIPVVPERRIKDDFHHPYTPYDVQLQFMRVAYDVLSGGDGQVGILESPTGTGKSLSLICSALSWLRSYKKQQHEDTIAAVKDGMKDEPDWMIEQMLHRKREELVQRWQEREERLAKIRSKEGELEARGKKRRRIDDTTSRRRGKDIDEDAEFLLDDWNDDEAGDDPMSVFSKETRVLMESMGLGAPKKQDEDTEDDDEIKIFYTSRTHSQLSQFITELRRPSFPSSVPQIAETRAGDESAEAVKHVPLSSRQRLCINPSVTRLGSLSAINDRCTELQQSKSKEKCPFVPNAENLANSHRFRDTALATVPDIEDMFQLGKTLQVCPYYASRTAIPGAEIVTLPYPLLLQKSARDALGIKLEGNVVIIDEAHNIMDAVSNVYAAEIRLSDLRRARQLLGIYVRRFGKKLKGENRVMVAQVGRVVDSLSEWLDGALKAKTDQGIVDPNLLLKAKGADQLNLFQLIKYIQQSKLAFKVESYASHLEDEAASSGHKTVSSPVLHTLVAFITVLTNLSSEGRVFYEKIAATPPEVKLAYLLLSPTHAFSSIASSARAVILAGGTMSPFDDYKAHLFPSLASEKITTLSCGHVIPPSNLCVWTLASTRPTVAAGKTPPPGAGGDTFEFSFQRRSDKAMIRQLGLAILNICTIVPDGVVVFFPSYGYLDQVIAAWQAAATENGQGGSIWDRLQGKKALFRDMKGASSEDVLQEYTSAILGGDEQPGKPAPASQRGALLLSVVGGRMSEGINFSDRLGRCVVVVGLPYPNINSPEWKAKIEYIESSMLERLQAGDATSNGNAKLPEDAVAMAKQAARDFYENACMRAVNQSIGRAIRHQKDYAAIVLIDRRFGTERIRGKLPGWIRGGMQAGSEEKGLHGLMGALSTFFRGKREQG
ncbi:DNA repair helicase [Coniochaeta ligniaria NRRL 30616]|uniref:ATP-dependent DNA helicase CHL1 n=1 Tax=Coniochaeta ligniaria NRRL 30616 TaxID=1408157 RepID=A0A1J7IEU2_9PEZI|nr:DNA repair helicase [Coniochaeta ligniaria NRRL 30616]